MRDLPHWEQHQVCNFITFRTGDSLPASVYKPWLDRRDSWLHSHEINPRNPDWHSLLHLLEKEVQDEFHERFSRQLQQYLDAGHGECVLRRSALSKIVADSLLYFDGDRYVMGDFIVMPNHVHVLTQFNEGTSLKKQCYSWKKFTAGKINEALGLKGHFWQGESYDHIVRSLDQFRFYQAYIAENPVKGKLREGMYFHFKWGGS